MPSRDIGGEVLTQQDEAWEARLSHPTAWMGDDTPEAGAELPADDEDEDPDAVDPDLPPPSTEEIEREAIYAI